MLFQGFSADSVVITVVTKSWCRGFCRTRFKRQHRESDRCSSRVSRAMTCLAPRRKTTEIGLVVSFTRPMKLATVARRHKSSVARPFRVPAVERFRAQLFSGRTTARSLLFPGEQLCPRAQTSSTFLDTVILWSRPWLSKRSRSSCRSFCVLMK